MQILKLEGPSVFRLVLDASAGLGHDGLVLQWGAVLVAPRPWVQQRWWDPDKALVGILISLPPDSYQGVSFDRG